MIVLLVFIVLQHENCYSVGRINPWCRRIKICWGESTGGIFLEGMDEQIFG